MKKKIVIMGMAVLAAGTSLQRVPDFGERSGGAEADAEREVCGAGRDCRYGDQ